MMESGPTSRIPNLLHFLFFLALTFFAMLVSEAVAVTLHHGMPLEAVLKDQRLQLIVNVMTYAIALGLAFVAMPVFWQRPFLAGLQWNFAKVRPWLGLLGLLIGFAAQGLTVFIPHPKELPIEGFFRNPALIWFLAFFGVVVGPLFEEVLFRGFLLPAIAIAVDWMRIPRGVDEIASLENLIAWRSGSGFSTAALAIASIITSVLFALIHAPQLGYTWAAVGMLVCVSLVLCVVRIRTGSVAASTLVHGCYNLSVFVTLFASTGGFRHLDKI
jgi:membrane protease YdiL (CAAX protease family)